MHQPLDIPALAESEQSEYAITAHEEVHRSLVPPLSDLGSSRMTSPR